MKKIGLFLSIILLSLNSICQKSTLTKEEKLMGLSLLWKEASYNFAFFDRVRYLNWDSCYIAYMPMVQETSNDWEYYRVLEKFYVNLHDGHTRIFPPAALRNEYYGTTTKQFTTRFIENKVLITDVLDRELVAAGMKKGMVIRSVNNMDINEYVRIRVSPFMYASTPQDLILQTYGHFLLSGSTREPVLIGTEYNGTKKEFRIKREPWLMEIEIFEGNPLSYKVLPGNIGYLRIHNFTDTKIFKSRFDSIYSEILKTNGLVIDVRDNFGGSSDITLYVLKHLTDKQFQTSNWKSPKNIGAYKAWKKKDNWYESQGYFVEPFTDRQIYKKPVDVLCDESSFSAAEDFCVGFKTIRIGKLIGQKTAGSTGMPLIFNLPGGGQALVCSKNDFFPDGKEFCGIGVLPDIEVATSYDDIKKNTDTVLQAAIIDIRR